MKPTTVEGVGSHGGAIYLGWTVPAGADGGPIYYDYQNDSGATILEGSSVVVVDDGTIELAADGEDRPVGIALDDIDDGDSGPVQMLGPVDRIIVTGSVSAGDFGQLSSTPGSIDATASRTDASFIFFTEGGATPEGVLFAEGASGASSGADDHIADTTDAHDASAISFTPAGTIAATDVQAAIEEVAAEAGTGSLPWFNVMDYGAVGDGTTDDTAAINLAIADLNTATWGVLYCPGSTYKVTAALTTITASGMVMGDGMGAYDNSANVSAIHCTSQTAVLFTITGKTVKFRDIGLFNTFAGTPSAGAGIQVSGAFIGQKVDLESVVLSGFYVNIDRQVGAQWTNHNVWNWGPVLYGEKIQNTVNQDAGDWAISGCYYYADTHNAATAIYQLGAGGGKIANVKINGHGGATFTNGIEIAMPTGVQTSVGTIAGCSIENVSGDAIKITTSGTARFGLFAISALEVALYSNNTGRAVNIIAASTGGVFTNGGIGNVIIDGLTAATNGTARAAVALTNTDGCVLGEISYNGFNARYTGSGDTNTIDGASVSFATPSIALGSSAAAGAASTVIRSDSTIAAFDVTVPVTQAFGDAAATGSAAFAARRDHRHGMPSSTLPSIVLESGHAVPFTFDEILQTSDGSDFLHASG